LGANPVVKRNDAVSVEEVAEMKPERIVISPGPGSPKDAGISMELIRRMGSKVPLLGVCLGHQCIGEVYGGKVVRAGRLMHGKTSPIRHDTRGVFQGLPNPFEATRYHSLIVEKSSVPNCLEISADTAEREIMGLRHREYPVHGVQFHPESILSKEGKDLLANFLKI
ncbi:MAG: aminodeoxychorismate/anthranilate synthase component II, partial [Verrucomicrobia bacterium]|nr:aminodeoxychorismate/anthranilate synthase component II [Verrucomicrobiota bacterium]